MEEDQVSLLSPFTMLCNEAFRCSLHEPFGGDRVFIMSQYGVSAYSAHLRTAMT